MLESLYDLKIDFVFFFSCNRNGPQSDDDDSCSINSDPEAKVCKNIHNGIRVKNLQL